MLVENMLGKYKGKGMFSCVVFIFMTLLFVGCTDMKYS